MIVINYHALVDLRNLITKFWKVELIPYIGSFSEDDQGVEKFYLDHTTTTINK